MSKDVMARAILMIGFVVIAQILYMINAGFIIIALFALSFVLNFNDLYNFLMDKL